MTQPNPPVANAMQVTRIFEQPPNTLSAYSDFAQVIGTGSEVVLQFYETIPDVPGPNGQIQLVRTRLRATLVVSKAHAQNIGRLLLQHAAIDVEQVLAAPIAEAPAGNEPTPEVAE